MGRAGLPPGFLRRRGVAGHHRVRHHPVAPEPKEYGRASRFYGSHNRRRLADPVHDLQRHLDLRAVPGRRRGQRQPGPTASRRSSRMRWAHSWNRWPHDRDHRNRRSVSPHRRDAGVPADRAALQAPAHRPGRRSTSPSSDCPMHRPLLPMESRPIHRLRKTRRGRGVRPRQNRGLHLEGYLDLTTCTECGRCQSQCPAWNTGNRCPPRSSSWTCATICSPRRPISSATAGFTDALVDTGRRVGDRRRRSAPRPRVRFERVPADSPLQATRPLVGDAAALGVIDPDVLWSCTTCGACVEQCPVDIEHIDHIVDMRRYQVMMESEFPGELGGCTESGNQRATRGARTPRSGSPGSMRWISTSRFYGKDVDRSPGSSTCSVGCAGVPDDRARRPPRRSPNVAAAG